MRDRFEIQPNKPIPDLDMPSAKAFEVQDRRGAGRPLYALVCRPDILQRHLVMRSLRGMQNAGMLQFIEGGVVDWMPAGRKLVVAIYERPAGGKMMPDLNGTCEVVPDQLFAKKIIKPLHAALQELQTRATTHRAIRPDNIYLFDTKGDRLVLGDCVTAPPGFDNAAIFEPLETAMCMPEGRGTGHYSDDMFSLGVTLLFLMLGHNPTRGRSADEVMRLRLQQGTYATLVGENRVPISMIEVLRGLLHDDSRERWTIETLDLWLNGRRMTPLQPRLEKRSQRTLKIGEVEYATARGAAWGLMTNWSKAGALLQEGRVEVWLRRGLEDNEKADALVTAMKVVEAMQGDKATMADLMIARAIMVLAPDAPLCFRDVRCTLDGFGTALAHAVLRKGDVKAFADIISREVVKFWVQAQMIYNPEYAQADANFKELRALLLNNAKGFGIERVTYELNENMPCQSPFLEGEYVTEIKELLPALEHVSKGADTKTWPVDRHVAAFVAARYERDLKPQLTAMNEGGSERNALGMLSLLAVLQWRLGPEALFGLTSWLGGLVQPIINSYHSRERRKRLEREIPRVVRKGSLPELYNLLDNAEERGSDGEGFARAKAEYAEGRRQVAALETGQAARDENALRMGHQAAAIGSVSIGMATILILLLVRLI
ncbi:protein kinase family protein [Caenispirillum bisanense]